MDPYYLDIRAKDIEDILANEISVEESLFFKNLTIDSKSLEVKLDTELPQISSTTVIIVTEAVTQKPDPPRRCFPLELDYCKKLGYNMTTYPNIFKHWSVKDVKIDVISFRELVSFIHTWASSRFLSIYVWYVSLSFVVAESGTVIIIDNFYECQSQ